MKMNLKKAGVIFSFLLILTGCGEDSMDVKLTKAEIKNIGNDKNRAAAILIEKAVFNEMSKAEYTKEEKEQLKKFKKNVEKEYFLNKKAGEKTVISDETVLAVYTNNKEKLEGKDPAVILPQIKEQLYKQKLQQEKINYLNSLIQEYNLNEELKKSFPDKNQK